MLASNPTPSMIRSLERAVNTALFKVGLTEEDIYQGQILHTDLPWQLPPLYSEATLGGVPMYMYLDAAVPIDVDRVIQFWDRSLNMLYIDPAKALDKHGMFTLCRMLMPRAGNGQYKFRFSVPDGFPKRIDEFAGAMLTLELVQVLKQSLPVELVQSANDYYVQLASGERVGISGGVLCIETHWDTDVSDLIWSMTEVMRGRVDTRCQYDALAKVRSLCFEHKDKFPEYHGLDIALQALRALYNRPSDCMLIPKVAQTIDNSEAVKQHRAAWRKCLETLDRKDISDRAKINIMYSALVPNTLSETRFSGKIYRHDDKIPFTLTDKVLFRITEYVKNSLNQLPPVKE